MARWLGGTSRVTLLCCRGLSRLPAALGVDSLARVACYWWERQLRLSIAAHAAAQYCWPLIPRSSTQADFINNCFLFIPLDLSAVSAKLKDRRKPPLLALGGNVARGTVAVRRAVIPLLIWIFCDRSNHARRGPSPRLLLIQGGDPFAAETS